MKLRLRDVIEIKYGLFQSMQAHGILKQQEYSDLNDLNSTYEKVDKLLKILCSDKSEGDCEKFMRALSDTGQRHVVNFIRYCGGITCLFYGTVHERCSNRFHWQIMNIDIYSLHNDSLAFYILSLEG